MRLIAFVFMMVGIVACQQKKEETEPVVFSGQIENRNSDSLIVTQNESFRKTIHINSDGSFSDTISITKEGFFNLFDGTEYTTVYLKPGYVLTLNFNAKAFDESLVYQGNGANENNYIAKKNLLQEKLQERFNRSVCLKLNEIAFLALIDSVSSVKYALLNTHAELDSIFRHTQDQEIKLYRNLALDTYKEEKTSGENAIKLSENFPNPFSEINLNDRSLIEVPTFLSYVERFCENKMKSKRDNHENDFLSVLLTEISDSLVREEVVYRRGMWEMETVNNLDDYYDQYVNILIKKEYKRTFYEKYEVLNKTKPGNISPTFELYSMDDTLVTLSMLKGNYVYIDVWATWCKPCLEEIPYLIKLEEEFRNLPLQFVGICMEKSDEKWKAMVKEKQLKGIQLQAPNKDIRFFKDYLIESIPRFILLDKEGKIINANAKRPSDPELKEIISNLISAQNKIYNDKTNNLN